MKKVLKKTAALLLALLLAAGLAGCGGSENTFLSRLRDQQAVFEDDTHEAIVWKGIRYRRYTGNGPSYFVNHSRSIYVTDPDVPVLLARGEGNYANVNPGGTIIEVSGVRPYYETVYYLKEDSYDELSKVFDTDELTEYCVMQTFYAMDDPASVSLYRVFDASEKARFQAILQDPSNLIKKQAYYEAIDSAQGYIDSMSTVASCDPTVTFTKEIGNLEVVYDDSNNGELLAAFLLLTDVPDFMVVDLSDDLDLVKKIVDRTAMQQMP